MGKPWDHPTPPCSREMAKYLENQEKFVYWFQPKGSTYMDQVPAVMVQGEFYCLSLRMMKCIWRHTRLRKGFRNVERGHFGTYKLRIPLPLMQEKSRTQGRFNVSLLDLSMYICMLGYVCVLPCLQMPYSFLSFILEPCSLPSVSATVLNVVTTTS